MATNEEILASITSLSGDVSGLYDVTRILSNNDATLNEGISATRDQIVALSSKVTDSFSTTDSNISSLFNDVSTVQSSIEQARQELASKDVKFEELAAYLAEVRFDIADQREELSATFGNLDTKLDGRFDALTARVDETTQATVDLVTDQNQKIAAGLDFLTQSSATAFEDLNTKVAGLDEALANTLTRVEAKIDNSVERLGARVDRNLAGIDRLAGRIEDNFERLDELEGANEGRYNKLATKTDNLLARLDTRFDRVDDMVSKGFERLDAKSDRLFERMEVRFDKLGADISEGFADVKSSVVGRIDQLQDAMETGFNFVINSVNAGFQQVAERDAQLDVKTDQLLQYGEMLNAKSDALIGLNESLIERSDNLASLVSDSFAQATQERIDYTKFLTEQMNSNTTSIKDSITDYSDDLGSKIDSGFTQTNKNLSDGFTLLTKEIEYKFIDLNDSMDQQFQGTLDSIDNSTSSLTNTIDSATNEIITSLSPGNSLFGQSQGSGRGR